MKTNTMTLSKRLLDAASTDKQRECLQGAHVDPEHRCVVVCDGRVLALTPIPGEAPIKPGHITPGTWKDAKAKNSKFVEYDFTAGTINGIPLDDMPPGSYPNYRQVMPREAVAYRICLNPEFIARIGATLDFDAESKSLPMGITFEFDSSGEAPVRVSYGDKTGVIMPCRGGKKGEVGLIGSDGSASEMVAEIERLKTALSERSDNAAPHTPTSAEDAAVIAALTASLHEERARVRQLEASAAESRPAAAPAVKPLDAKPAGKAERKAAKVPPAAATERPTLTRNEERDGIELRFNGKPDEATLTALRDRKWRWLPGQPGQPWAKKFTEEEYLFAQSLATGSAYTPMPEVDAEAAQHAEWIRANQYAAPVATPAATPAPAPAARRRIVLPDF